MAQNMLAGRAVAHNVGGQLRKVFLVEKAHGKLPDMLGDMDSRRLRLLIGSDIGFFIVVLGSQKHKESADKPEREIHPKPCK